MKQFITKQMEMAGLTFGRLCRANWFRPLVSVSLAFRRGVWRGRLAALGKDSNIFRTARIMRPERVSIGNHVNIGDFVHIWGGGGVTIGNDSLIASHAIITSQTHDVRAGCYRESMLEKPVVIGRNVWIGAGAVILPGIQVGDNAVIGAGSVVTADVPPDTTVFGVPARLTSHHKRAGSS